jgi:hypothetical protein
VKLEPSLSASPSENTAMTASSSPTPSYRKVGNTHSTLKSGPSSQVSSPIHPNNIVFSPLPSHRKSGFAPCSIVAMHSAFRALAHEGLYTQFFHQSWALWRQMIEWETSTWEEDPVSQRTDRLAWGSLALYEYTSEVAVVKPGEAGWKRVLWEPKPALFDQVDFSVAGGRGRVTRVTWNGSIARLRLPEELLVSSRLPGSGWTDHGAVKEVVLTYKL